MKKPVRQPTTRSPGVAFFGKVRIPTIGHLKAIGSAKDIARRVNGRLHIGLSGTAQPLPIQVKRAHAEMLFGHPVETGEDHTKNIFSFLTHLAQQHDEMHLVAGSDRAEEYRQLLKQWNGKADKSGKVLFNFKKWQVHEVEGKREEATKHPTEMNRGELERSVSASALEKIANAGDYPAFRAYHPDLPEKHVRNVYNQIRLGSKPTDKPAKPKSVKQIREELDHKQFGPMLDSFVSFASEKLGIKSLPQMKLAKDEMDTSFGGYSPGEKSIVVVSKNRHPMDVFRTVAHELVHHKQNEDGRLGKDIAKEGSTGSDIENEANAEAGKIMRWFAKSNPDTFKSGYVVEAFNLKEGLNDPAKMKAVFLAGGPGSGKDFVMQRVLVGHGMTEINSDTAFEFLMKRQGLDPMMPPEEEYERNIARGKAKNMTKEKERLALAGRRGVIINGTADDPEKIAHIKKQLEDSGYETKMLFVNTSDEVSRQRNHERGLGGNRKVPDGTDRQGRPDGTSDIRGEKWRDAQKAREGLRKLFGDEHYREVDNTDDMRKVSPERKAELNKQHLDLYKHYREFTAAPVATEKGKSWVEAERKKRGVAKYTPAKATKMSQKKPAAKMPEYTPNASELEQAKRLGVEHIGGGQFGKKSGKESQMTHQSRNGQLTMAEEKKYKKIKACWKGYQAVGFKNKNGKRVPNCVPVDEMFDTFVKENSPSDREWGKPTTSKIYAEGTPGEKAVIKKNRAVFKKIATEDSNINPGSLPMSDGVGPEFSRRSSPTYFGFNGIQESVEKWANNPETIQRFSEKYGVRFEEKLMEAAHRLNQLDVSKPGPKFFTHMREAWEAKGNRDMGSVPSTGREEFEEDWQKVNRQDKTDGLSQKAVNAYRRENPGSKLKTAVTEKNPSGKRASRRKSFCSRMSGMKKRLTSAETARDPDSRINKALRRWNCEE